MAEGNIANVTESKNRLRPYLFVVYIVAFLQILIPLLLGTPVFSALGIFIAALGFAIGRMSVWAAIVLIIFGVINAVTLALQAGIGSTVQSVLLVACGIRAVGIIRHDKAVKRQASNSLEHLEQLPVTIVGQRPLDEGKSQNGAPMKKRVVVVAISLIAVAIVIALGAPPTQGGLLGAAIMFVFWNWGKNPGPVRSEHVAPMVEKDVTAQTFVPVNKGQIAEARPSAISAGLAPCPFCAEDIKVAAVLCRFCGSNLPLGWATVRGKEELVLPAEEIEPNSAMKSVEDLPIPEPATTSVNEPVKDDLDSKPLSRGARAYIGLIIVFLTALAITVVKFVSE
jgi:hypothetical protein